MTGRQEERQTQHIGAGKSRPGRLGTAARLIILAAGATLAAPPAFALQPPGVGAESGRADAVVAQLRELPPPMRAFAHGTASAKGGSPSLPDLELRRQRVYDRLHALGPQSVRALARALRDPDPEMRRNVAVALDVVGGGWWQFPDGGPKLDLRPALPAMLAALQDSAAGVRAWAAQDVGDMGAGAAMAVPRLRAMLHRPDPESRGSACRALGQMGSAADGALPDLHGALADPSQEVRQAARDAIASIGRADALR